MENHERALAAASPGTMRSVRIGLTLLLALVGEVTAQDLSRLSTQFNEAADLDAWTWHHDTDGWSNKMRRVDVNTTRPGMLYMVPRTSVWYYDYTAPFMYHEITGDFVVTTRIRVSGLEGPMPSSIFSLAGLMVRRPREEAPFESEDSWQADREDYVFLVTGTTMRPGEPYIETKSSIRSQPLVKHWPLDSAGWVDLRLARVGSSIIALVRLTPNSGWVVHERWYRPDLGRHVQVGIMAYSDFRTIQSSHWYHPWEYNTSLIEDGHEDMQVEVDYVTFFRPAVTEEGEQAVGPGITWDNSRISDRDLLRFIPALGL